MDYELPELPPLKVNINEPVQWRASEMREYARSAFLAGRLQGLEEAAAEMRQAAGELKTAAFNLPPPNPATPTIVSAAIWIEHRASAIRSLKEETNAK